MTPKRLNSVAVIEGVQSRFFQTTAVGNEFHPANSRVAPRADPKRCPPLTPDIVPFLTVKGHWIKKGYEGPCGIQQRTVLHPSFDDSSQLWGWTLGEKRSSSPSVSTPYLSSGIDLGKLIFQRANDSPYQAFPSPNCKDVAKTCLRTIRLRLPQTNLERDCFSSPGGPTGRGSANNR